MATTADYLTQLQTDKQTLVDNLNTKGVEASSDETFTSLVPKVLDIEGGGGEGSSEPLIFVQDTEPEIKKGIWIKSTDLLVTAFIPYNLDGENSGVNNALIYRHDRENRPYYIDLYNTGQKTFSFTDVDYYSESTGYTRELELYYGNDTQWILLKKPLPSLEYRRVIACTGYAAAYINSEVIPDENLGFDICCKHNQNAYTDDSFFGSRQSYYQSMYQFTVFAGANSPRGTFGLGTAGSGSADSIRYNAPIFHGERQLFSFYPREYLVINDGTITTVPDTYAITVDLPIYIFALNQNNSVIEHINGTIYNLRFYNGDVLIRNFIPVQYNTGAGWETGLYDLINSKYYGNIGDGYFVSSN